MRSGALVGVIGAGATVAVLAGALIQAASDDPVLSKALTISVPDKYRPLVEKAGSTCPEVTPNLLAALLSQESDFIPDRTSPAGAQGIAQFMPSTWQQYGLDGNNDGKRNIWDPADAIPSAAKYLCTLAKDVKDVPGDKQSNMLAAYNAGSDAVKHFGGVPPYKETQGYVRSINALAGPPGQGNSGGGKPGSPATVQQGATVVNAAQDMLGTQYSWGGGDASGPTTGTCCSPNGSSGGSTRGFDCSGLTIYAYGRVGISLPRTAAEQYKAGEPVKREDMRPGDLVFYGSTPDSIHHVGIYVGGGYMVNAPRPGTSVRFDSITSMSDLYGVARPKSNTSKGI